MGVKRKWGLKDEEIDDRDWATGLPNHLLELVIERLSLVDCLSFSNVCNSWKTVTTELFEGCSRGIPLLVKHGKSENISRTCLNVLGKYKNPTFNIPMPELIGSHIWGSYRDWLFFKRLFEGYLYITLQNPFSGEKVALPKTDRDHYMVVLSSVPSDPRCVYMLVGRALGVAFWTSGARREWRKCANVMESGRVVDALFHDRQFYLLKHNYEMVVIDEKSVVNMLNTESDFKKNKSCIATQNLGLSLEIISGVRVTRKYIVESSGDILLVCRIFYRGGPRGFETYKLDVSGRAWVKLDSLGDKIIMLGRSCSRSFHAKKELGDDALANNIYFINTSCGYWIYEWNSVWKDAIERNADADDWGVFSLHKETSDWSGAFGKPRKRRGGIWVTAPYWWCLRQLSRSTTTVD